REVLVALQNYLGIEIYNGTLRRSSGSPVGTNRWDELLNAGRRVWGFGNDDSHFDGEAGLGWNVVQARNRSVEGVLEALENGRFYVSTGVEIEHIGVAGRTITVRCRNAERIVAIVNESKRAAQGDTNSLTIRVPEDAGWTYIRFECWGSGEAMAWTQPF